MLPNNGNIVMAARAAQELTKKQVAIVPTDTIPQGIAALLAFNADADLETNRRHMERAMSHVQTVEITMAVRSTHLRGHRGEGRARSSACSTASWWPRATTWTTW